MDFKRKKKRFNAQASGLDRKTRSDAKLLNLPEDQQEQIFEWCHGLGFKKTVPLIYKEYGIGTSEGALSYFYEVRDRVLKEDRILRASIQAGNITRDMASRLPLIDKATEAALKQAAFESLLEGNNDRRVKTYLTLILKSKALENDTQSLELKLKEFETKIESAKDIIAKSKTKGGVDKQTLEELEAELNLL